MKNEVDIEVCREHEERSVEERQRGKGGEG